MRPDDVDPIEFLSGLNRAKVRWLLIGRQALILYGAPMQTFDWDLWIAPSSKNVQKLLDVARDLGLEGPARASEVAGRPQFILHGGRLSVDVFKVRIFTNPHGESVDFDGAYDRKVVVRAEGDPLHVPVPAIPDLRVLKRMRDEPRDREDLAYLETIERIEAEERSVPRRRKKN